MKLKILLTKGEMDAANNYLKKSEPIYIISSNLFYFYIYIKCKNTYIIYIIKKFSCIT